MIEALIQSAREYLPGLNVSRLSEAFDFARQAHEGQLRKGGDPYITHPVAAAEILTEMRVDEDTLVACLLHDVPEDTDYEITDIEERFGEKVAFLVEGITKLSKVYYRHDMEDRQIESLKKLFLHSARDPRTILIKLADRLHNMRTLDALPREKQERIARETLEIYVPIANLLGLWRLKYELEDCCFKSLRPKDYAEIEKLVNESAARKKSLVEESIKAVQDLLGNTVQIREIGGRRKSFYSIHRKIRDQNKAFHEVYDLIGLRIIVEDVTSCYQVLGLLHQNFRPKLGRLKDYIGNPKSNGYQSIHTTVFGLEGTLTEFQIRTYDMHLENEYGIAAHFFYRQAKDKQQMMQNKVKDKYLWVKQILDMQRTAQDNKKFLENLKIDMFEDRIFVFTPRGDVVDLPKGANVMDFAYQIHTNLAEKATAARVNGIMKKLTHVLENGDVIHVENTQKGTTPRLFWFYEVKTNMARNKIRQYLRRQSDEFLIEEAKDFFDERLRLFGLGKMEELSMSERAMLIEHFEVENWDEFLLQVGRAHIDMREVIGLLFTKEELFGNQTVPLSAAAYERKARPLHQQPQTIYRVNTLIEMKNRVGILGRVCQTLADLDVNIIKVDALLREIPDAARVRFILEIRDLAHYQKMASALHNLEDVIKVERLQNAELKLLMKADAHKKHAQ